MTTPPLPADQHHPALCVIADSAGESHLVDLAIPIMHKLASADGGAVWTGLFGAHGFGIAGPASGGDHANWHRSTSPGLSVVLEGAWEIEASSGQRRLLERGAILVMLDTHGRGHFARTRQAPCSTLGLALDDDTGARLRAAALALLPSGCGSEQG